MNLNTGISGRIKSRISNKKTIIGIVCLLLVGAIAFAGYNYFKPKRGGNTTGQLPTAVVMKGDLSVTVSGSGPISSSKKYDLTSNVNGTLTKIYFKDGDKVKAGDLIFEIDDKDAQLQIKQLKNSIALAQLTRDNDMQDYLASTVTAPIDGEVTDLQAKEGDNISSNGTLLTITDKSKLKLLVSFNNTYRSKLYVGQKVTVNAYDSAKDELHIVEGTITSISSPSYTTGDGNEVYNVGVVMENSSSLTDGMIGNVVVNIDGREVISKGSGTLSYLKSMTVKAPSGGVIEKLNVENGQIVKQGDVLAQLENEDLKLTIQTNDLKLEDLYSELKTAEEKLLDYKIYAPFDGTLTLNDIEQGNSIKQGDILGGVANYDTMEFDIDVDELDIAKLKEGQSARVSVDALPETTEKPLKGTVTKIAVEGSSSNGVSVYPVTVQIENNNALKGGMNANAEIVVNQKKDVLYVPVDAIQKRNGKSFVRLARTDQSKEQKPNAVSSEASQQFEMREVETGISTEQYIEIVKGLKEGDRVVVTSQQSTGGIQRGGNMMIMGAPAGGPGGGGFRRGN